MPDVCRIELVPCTRPSSGIRGASSHNVKPSRHQGQLKKSKTLSLRNTTSQPLGKQKRKQVCPRQFHMDDRKPTQGQSSSHGATNAQLRGPSKMAHRGSMRSETHQSPPNQVTGSLSGFRPLQSCATARGPSASPLLDHFFSHLWT